MERMERASYNAPDTRVTLPGELLYEVKVCVGAQLLRAHERPRVIDEVEALDHLQSFERRGKEARQELLRVAHTVEARAARVYGHVLEPLLQGDFLLPLSENALLLADGSVLRGVAHLERNWPELLGVALPAQEGKPFLGELDEAGLVGRRDRHNGVPIREKPRVHDLPHGNCRDQPSSRLPRGHPTSRSPLRFRGCSAPGRRARRL